MTTIIAARGSRWENPSMHLAASTLVADIAADHRRRIEAFERHGIGFCCADWRRASAAPASRVPDDGGNSYRARYEGLLRFERELHEHVRLENSILLPLLLSLGVHAVRPR